MSYVIFENDGEIDPNSITTFGVSVKETANPIGFFGTGLKYAISILLREKHTIQIYSGLNVYNYTLNKKSVRGKEFDIIAMNGVDLSFTNELGKTWKIWQAFRELYCNTVLDEAGSAYLATSLPEPKSGKTFVMVSGRDFENAYFTRDEIILNLPVNLIRSEGAVTVYDKPSKHLYYRKIRVLDLQKPSMFTYNVETSLDLTEDRTIKFEHHALARLPMSIARMTNKNMIRRALTCGDEYFESQLSYDSLTWNEEQISTEFIEVLSMLYESNNDRINKTARKYLIKRMNKSAAKSYKPMQLTNVMTMQIGRCIHIAAQVYPDITKYEIMVVDSLGENTMALADMDESKIVLSKRCFELGTKYLLSTLLEEYAHLKTGHFDHSRELQTWLFDQLCCLIENHVIKEPI